MYHSVNAGHSFQGRKTVAIPTKHRGNEQASYESLLFDMDLSVSCSGPSILSSMPEIDDSHFDSDLFAIIAEVEQHVVLRTQFERQLMQTYMLVKGSCEEEGHLDLEKLMKSLQSMHFSVKLIGLNKEHKPGYYAHLTHPFILCFGKTEDGPRGLPYTCPTPCILDPFFKAQFDVPHPSATYATLMEAVPDMYLGSYSRLENLVHLLCQEMHKSFQSVQCALPPWRTLKSMLSRWVHPIENITLDDRKAIVGST